MLQLRNILIESGTNSKNKIIRTYIYLAYIGLFLSVGENIRNISFSENSNFLDNLKALRSITPYIVLPLNLMLILILGKLKNTNNIINYFVIFLVFQFIGLLIKGFDLFHLQFIIGPLSILSLIFIINNSKDFKILENLIKITFLIIATIVIIFIYQNPNLSYGGGEINFFDKSIIFINSNGLSRYLVILYTLVLTFFISTKENYIKFFIISLIIGILIFKYEGRLNILTFCTISLFIYFKNKKFVKNSLVLIFLFFLSIYISSIWELSKKKNFSLKESELLFDLKTSPTNRYSADGKNYFTKKDVILGITESFDNLSTGRTEKWKLLLSHKQNFKNILLGNGPEFDRYLLTESNKLIKKTTGTDSANSLIYVYLCGGLISLLLFIFLGIDQLYKILKILKKKYFIKNQILTLSILCFIIIGIRAMFENGLSVWSIDLILFILFGSIINSKNFNK